MAWLYADFPMTPVRVNLNCHHIPRRKHVLYELILILFLVSFAYPARTVEPAPARHKIDNPSEYELKAIYLYNFLQFVEWPAKDCTDRNKTQKKIVVLGDSSLRPVLKALQQKLQAKNQQLQLTFYGQYSDGLDISDCSLLFISDSERNNLEDILDKVANKPVLTVSDAVNFAEKGVMITLLSYNHKVRWTINRKPVREAGLRLSAKLLDIAVEVID